MVKIHSLFVVVQTSFRVQLRFKLNNIYVGEGLRGLNVSMNVCIYVWHLTQNSRTNKDFIKQLYFHGNSVYLHSLPGHQVHNAFLAAKQQLYIL